MDLSNQMGACVDLLDCLDEEVSLHAKDGEVLFLNARLLQSMGGAAADWTGRRCDDLFPQEECPHEAAMRTGKSAQLKDGTNGRTITVVPFGSSAGESAGYARIVRRPETPSQDALLKAEHFATLGQMMSGIAHDVGTPLNIISGYAEYLLMRTKPEETGHKELMAILEQTRRVAEYIRIMLDLARPTQGRVDAIELKGFLGDSLEMMGSHLRKASVRVALVCKSAPPVIYGDGPQLRQAFFNLLLNAGRRLGAGGQLELSIEQPPELPGFIGVQLSGIDREGRSQNYAETFAGFLSAARRWGAEDMGLALAKEIFDGYGAKVTTLPVNGRGVALVVYLPKGAGGLLGGRRA